MITIVNNIQNANCITHAGSFHADDIFSTILLEEVLGNVYLYRASSVENYHGNAIIYDIGLGEFDHHMESPKLREENIPYASFGLLWKRFGKEYLEKIAVKKGSIQEYFEMIDKNFVFEIDAIDNGVFPPQNKYYKAHTLSEIIETFNPTWKENESEECFLTAIEIGKLIMKRLIKRIMDKVDAKEYVEKEIEKTKTPYIIFERHLPFMDYIVSSNHPNASFLLYAITPSNRGGYNIRAINKNLNTHENRKDFPKNWGGKTKEELVKLTGIKTFRFCHPSLFLATADVLEDAIKIAELASKKE